MTPKEKKIIQESLEGIIQKALGAPHGDPDHAHMMCAACAYLTMKKLKLDMSNVEGDGDDDEESSAASIKGRNLDGCDYTKIVNYKGDYKPEK